MSGLLNKGITIANSFVKIGEVPNNANYSNVTLNIANDANDEVTFRVYVTTSDIPATGDLYISSKTLAKGEDYQSTCMLLSRMEKIFIKADKDNVICRSESVDDISVSG